MLLLLTGGFLGSGKTTAIAAACRQLISEGKKVGVITNDQGDQQVDSELFRQLDIPNREVANGCFCCNYTLLDQHIQSLVNVHQPDVLFAESVGSCTDLVATIVNPLQQFRPSLSVIISVFADAPLLLAILEHRAGFINDNVQYLFKKQLEDADIIVLNKTDLITAEQATVIRSLLADSYPGKTILFQNSLHPDHIANWLNLATGFLSPEKRTAMDVDYDRYADAESQLAWYDRSIDIHTLDNTAVPVTRTIIERIHNGIRDRGWPIAHLKFFASGPGWQRKISFTMLPQPAVGDWELPACNNMQLLINARVQTSPGELDLLIGDILKTITHQSGCRLVIHRTNAFRPGYPKPDYRITH